METVSLLRADPGLAGGMPKAERATAERLLQAPLLTLTDGVAPPARRSTTAHLLIDGLLLRRVTLGTGLSVELLARGDVIFPAREDAASFVRSEWEVVEPARLAAIDLSPGSAIWRWPSICTAIAMRAMDRSRALAVQAAIMSIVGVEERAHSLLWALSERWGRVTDAGVALDLKVHQQVLAEMVGARRPTVSMALGSLCDRGLVINPEPGCWVLQGSPPPLAPRSST
jgi:hypothetical protein